ncbi:MAG: hypothetical protein N2745_03635 [Syntrophorhabdaceae bacterium]|nr:hypothetical protein [Syntrophorhabdaceae bacterium]
MDTVKIFYKDDCPLCPSAKKLKDNLKQHMVNTLSYNVGTAEGLAEATFYRVMALPTILIEDDGENLVKEWRGTVPKIEEVLYIVNKR